MNKEQGIMNKEVARTAGVFSLPSSFIKNKHKISSSQYKIQRNGG
jgi:hypothetical protein